MKKHIVTCVKCGRQFDANEGGAYYPESRRYVCKHCVDKQKDIQKEQAKARKAAEREAEADERERVTGMRQSKTAMLVKIVVGVLFLFAAVSLACTHPQEYAWTTQPSSPDNSYHGVSSQIVRYN